MIYVNRTPKPQVLIRNEKKWTLAIKSAKNKVDKEKAIGKYKHEQIKKALSDLFHDKCAYCESYIGNVSYGDIEHYKPKKKFPALAVSWENLLLSCSKCNGAGQKGDTWITKKQGGPLVNPTKEKPDLFFNFEFDEKTKIAYVKPINKRGLVSESTYGLNKHSLLKDRNIFVRKLIALAKNYHTDVEAKTLLDEAVTDQGEYSAFARMVKAKYT